MGTFLRSFTFGHVRQLDGVAARLLARLAARAPLLPGAAQVTFIDVDDTMRETHGYAKQGVGYGYSKVKGLNALIATVSTPRAAPVIAATRLRKGSVNSARGAARLITDALVTARACGAGGAGDSGDSGGTGGTGGTGLTLVRADSAFYGYDSVAAARRGGARLSITARMNPAVAAAVTTISETDWTPISYPNAIWDEDEQRLISDAEVAEVGFTAFTSRRKAEHITARLIVRRVKRLNPGANPQGGAQQAELFAVYRYHAVFTDNPMPLIEAEKTHTAGTPSSKRSTPTSKPVRWPTSGSFAANSAWLVLAAIAFNLTRAAGCLASVFHARATTATIRAHLIHVPARLARSARKQHLHLPSDWPWEQAWTQLFDATLGPPPST